MKLTALVSLAAALCVGLAVPASAAAVLPTDTSDFTFESFSADYYLDTDAAGAATMRVVETLVAVFPDFDQNRGIIRAIPLSDGEYPLELTMISVTDGAGNPVYFERNDYDGFAEFALGTDEFVQGRTTYVLEYTMRNSIRSFSDSRGDEFYWDINGTGWQQSFGTVTARVFLSDGLAGALTGDASCYVGSYGATTQCEFSRGDSAPQFTATVTQVGAYSTLTIAIAFDGATVTQPTLPRDSWIVQIVPKVLLALQGLVALLAIVLRSIFWRDARGRGTVIAQYVPPPASDLLLDANLVNRPSSGLAAQFVDFAVRGLVKIIDEEPAIRVGSDSSRFSLELVTSDGANSRELGVLVALFGKELDPGKRINPGSLSARIGASLYALPASATAIALSRGLRAEPGNRLPRVFGRTAFWLIPAFIPVWAWAAFNDVLDANVVLFAVATVVLGVAVPIILIKPKLLTRAGAEAKEYLVGIREYLTIAEEDRMRVLQSPQGAARVDVTDAGSREPTGDAVVGLNERLLGYAVLWGVEDQWVRQLRAHYADRTPDWLDGADFSPSMLSSFSQAATSSVRPIVTSSSSGGSSWSSSGGSSFSSGSSGGGFSGGGGGGGGGGGR